MSVQLLDNLAQAAARAVSFGSLRADLRKQRAKGSGQLFVTGAWGGTPDIKLWIRHVV